MSCRTRTLLALLASMVVACSDGDGALIDDDAGSGGDDARDATSTMDRDDAASLDAPASPGDGAPGDDPGPRDGASVDDRAGPDGAPADDAARDDAATPRDGAADAASCAAREVCGNGLDDDCNAAVDDGCVCVPGATQRCYDGAASAAGRGACVYGSMRCEGTSEFGRWGRCEGAAAPATERCDGVDNDCDGLVDDGFCRVGDACVADGEGNPANPCQVCVAREGSAASTAWGARSSSTVCRPSAGPCDVAETCVTDLCPDDRFARADTLCRASVGPCDHVEVCSGTSAACPADARTAASVECRASSGVCDVAERCDGVSSDCPADGFAPATTVCRASRSVATCDPAESCTGRDGACPPDAVTRGPITEVCGNSVDDDCDGMIDEGCTPCIAGSASGSPWQIHRLQGPVCFGRTFTQHGDPEEYAYARIPGETEAGWNPVSSATIDFAETSALCGRPCACLDGGEFTYFQTFFDVTPGYTVTSLGVTMAGVDDGARITVYNSAYPGGIVDAGSYILLGGTSVSTNLARYIVTGRNRVVITHLDDCCTSRSIAGVRVVVNGAALMTCS